MRALRFHAARDLRIEDVPEPGAPGPGEVTVRVAACGICGTDLHEYVAGPIVTPAEPHLLMPPQELADEIACLLDERDPVPVPLDRFVHPRNAPDHPKAIDRALRRHRREMERDGDGSDDE